MLDDTPRPSEPSNRLARLFALHRTEEIIEAEQVAMHHGEAALSDDQIADIMAQAIHSLTAPRD
ncbi:hypothetical protein [Tropicibacter naphthalenivorans]|uniref:Uncharacterized protein n=1 Tax=Tropicibacter naphthalenivorans TaxID=441103 RepID=A0A0P1G7G4_9RHOB|nr:hypothetical protein [Tropicibacter naphthalenivorans]CUH77643.1 hypothetical protein TRN7648_01582 [Tropicibacter naphthalenivorans]SMC54756.1 hypothetical protein SAMN04488093_10235 [Tropicibacter naphthalenivorans]